MKRILIASVALAAVASAACRIYDIDVYRNVNGRARGADGVTESFTCTADSLLWAEFFVGAANTGGHYVLSVLPAGSQTPIYTGNADAGESIHYQYVRADIHPLTSDPLIKGKEYVLKVTLSSQNPNDSINYYYSDQNPYEYGCMNHPLDGNHECPDDLSCRIEGVNRAVSRELAEEPVSQPDLSVDSIWVTQGAGATVTLHARVRNVGNRQFVAATTRKGSCLQFAIDGDPVNAVTEPTMLKVGGIALVTSVPVSPNRSIMHLVSVMANADKEVVEPNFDNNARYCPLSAQ